MQAGKLVSRIQELLRLISCTNRTSIRYFAISFAIHLLAMYCCSNRYRKHAFVGEKIFFKFINAISTEFQRSKLDSRIDQTRIQLQETNNPMKNRTPWLTSGCNKFLIITLDRNLVTTNMTKKQYRIGLSSRYFMMKLLVYDIGGNKNFASTF